MNSPEKADPIKEVSLLIVAIFIGLIGVYLRFAEFAYSSEVADVIFLIAIVFAIKVVLDLLKEK
jgi:hypothetical protein